MTHSLFWFALTELVLSLSPGPAVFLVLSNSLRHGFAAGMGATTGIVGVNVFYFILSLIGVGAALAASPGVFLALKYLGAAYLGWTALLILRDLFREADQFEPAEVGHCRTTARGWRESVPSGIVIQASSVKNLMVFLAIVPQFVDHTGNIGAQFVGLCVVSVLVELPILAGYAYLASTLSKRLRTSSIRFNLDLASALILLAIATFVVWPSGV